MKWRKHKHKHKGHDYVFSPVVTVHGMNGEERLLNCYQVLAMIEQVSWLHRNKQEMSEVWKKHLREIKE